jgi:hypothetical protein
MLNERLAVQTAVDLEAAREYIAPRRVKRDLTEKVLKLRPEQSDRKIAETVGVHHKTVAEGRTKLESTGEIPQFNKTVGKDGKSRPTKKPNPRPEPTRSNPPRPGWFRDASVSRNAHGAAVAEKSRANVRRRTSAAPA